MSIEKNASFATSVQILRIAFLVIGFLGAVSAAVAQSPAGCDSTNGSEGTFALTLDTSVASSKGTDEWNSDVIKLTVLAPGVLVVSAEGPEVRGLVYTPDPSGGEPLLLQEKGIGSAGRMLALAVEPGEYYCLHITPRVGTFGSVRVQATLIGLTVPNAE